ncbi:MAG: hypothetical protein IJB43_10935, partial [Clostridia bacterium]|nr:hypothetical protein [Clostridia bacterium]
NIAFPGVPSSPAAAGASPRRSLEVSVSFVWVFLIFELFIKLKFALANFYLNLSLKAKDFTRAKREFNFCEAKISHFSAGEIFHSRRSLVPQASPGRSSRRSG